MKKWSISAHNCFTSCQRKYFFRYIMAHHNAKDPLRREAYLASQLSSIAAWKGKLVHSALETYFIPSLQRGNLISNDELTQKTLTLAQQQFKFSQQKQYRQAGVTKTKAAGKYLALKIHETENIAHLNIVETVFDEIQQCYQNLYNHHKFISFLVNKADWYETEFRLSFKQNGVTIVGQPDVLIGYSNSSNDILAEGNTDKALHQICIIDWKTGKNPNSDYSTQLYLYALSVVNSRKWSDYDLSDLLLVEASLYQNKFNKLSIDNLQKTEIENFINSSISNIEAVTEDRKYNLSKLKNYSYTQNPSYCQYCNFESICKNLP